MELSNETMKTIFNGLYTYGDHRELIGQTLYLLGSGSDSNRSYFQKTEKWWKTVWWKEANAIVSIVTTHGSAMSDSWSYWDMKKEELEALNIQEATPEIMETAYQWLLARNNSDKCKLTFKPEYVNCVLLCFEDHNYYEDSDSWTVFYDANKHEIVEEYWTTRGYCPNCNANPKDIQFNLDNCPAEIFEEIKEYLRKDILESVDFKEMAENIFVPKYSYQQDSADACIKEFCEIAPSVVAEISDMWILRKHSKKVHTYTDFDYKYENEYKGKSLAGLISEKMTTTMVPVRQRSKAVYGKRYEGTVKWSKFYVADGYHSNFDQTAIVVDVEGIEVPVYLKLSGKKNYQEGSTIVFAGILGTKGAKYQFVNKAREINEGDKLSWH